MRPLPATAPGRARATLAAMALALAWPAASADVGTIRAEIDAVNHETLAALRREKDGGGLDPAMALAIIREHASPRFDFDMITSRAVGKFWRRADDAQRGELSTLFRTLLENTYAKTLSRFDDERISLQDAADKGKGRYSVKFDVVSEGRNVKVEYLVHDRAGDWRIYDVKIEGISLLASYRSQFSQVIRKDGIDSLIEQLRQRT